jgi:hypothetical protein
MTYILSAQRDHWNDAKQFKQGWAKYQSYLRENAPAFPPGAYALATSDWYHDFSGHQAPHDAWLEQFKLEETGTGPRNEKRHLSLTMRLLGAYHDRILEFYYPAVFSYEMSKPRGHDGHLDWRYDEFRLGDSGSLIHEIEWAGAGTAASWLIEASDVQFTVYSREAT